MIHHLFYTYWNKVQSMIDNLSNIYSIILTTVVTELTYSLSKN